MIIENRIGSFLFLCLFLGLIICSTKIYGQSLSYYIDSQGGNDSNSGHSIDSAWKSLSKINTITFQPGDQILLKSGSNWTGQIALSGSGTAQNPIIVNLYGGSVKPHIDAQGSTGDVLYLGNGEYWEINNLELTNNAAAAGIRRGMHVDNSKNGIVNHTYLKNLWIHNIKGTVGADGSDASKRTAGICIEGTTPNTRFDDVLISGCTIDSIDETGIIVNNTASHSDYPMSASWSLIRFTNLHITNNVIHDIAKNAMIIRLDDHGIIEYNICYQTATATTGNTMFTVSCNRTTFQYNEGYQNMSTANDGSMYDADLRSMNVVFQYSYSHDNAHGLLWFYTVSTDSGIICRYNISQNDKGNLISTHNDFVSAYIYNNIFYIGAGVSPTIIDEYSGTMTYYFYNNIIFNNSTGAKYNFKGSYGIFDHNVCFGNHPTGEFSDAHKITNDPLFVNPGSGTYGLNSLSGYFTLSGSPCVGAGIRLYNHCAADFWGNPIGSTSLINIGAYQFSVLPVEITSFNAVCDKNLVQLKWTTAVEINNSGFELERSADGNKWERIGFIKGAGNSNSTKNYSYTDKTLSTSGIYYYRLKQTDFNGSVKYSNVIETNFFSVNKYELFQNYPNPFNPSTVIKYKIAEAGLVTIKVFNSLGEEVSTLVNEIKQPGTYSLSFNAGTLTSGVYLCRIKAGSFSDVKKLTFIK